jgi:hypothetical protein
MPDKMPEDMSDRMREDLPVTKRIDVMVGKTRSKVIDDFPTNHAGFSDGLPLIHPI